MENNKTIEIAMEDHIQNMVDLEELKLYRAGILFTMPKSISIENYNALVKYLREQRKAILNSDPAIPKVVDDYRKQIANKNENVVEEPAKIIPLGDA